MKSIALAFAVVLVAGLMGCGSSPTPPEGSGSATPPPASSSKPGLNVGQKPMANPNINADSRLGSSGK